MDQSMSLEQFREAKQSGTDLYAEQEVQADAALNQEEDAQEHIDAETDVEDATSDDTEEAIEIPEAQQTAFQKALEREKRKAREGAEKKFKEQFETEYSAKLNPYQKFFEQLNMTPEQAMEAMEQNRVQQEAQRLAEYNGWDDQQTQMYMRQQDLERKQTEMTVNLRVYELSDTADFPGIKQMKGAITEFIRANPRVPVEQAYWAVGGANLATQLKREAEQREIAKRTQTKRTVISDAPTDMKGPEPMTPEAVAFMKRTGLNETEFRKQYMSEAPKTLEDFRKMNRKG